MAIAARKSRPKLIDLCAATRHCVDKKRLHALGCTILSCGLAVAVHSCEAPTAGCARHRARDCERLYSAARHTTAGRTKRSRLCHHDLQHVLQRADQQLGRWEQWQSLLEVGTLCGCAPAAFRFVAVERPTLELVAAEHSTTCYWNSPGDRLHFRDWEWELDFDCCWSVATPRGTSSKADTWTFVRRTSAAEGGVLQVAHSERGKSHWEETWAHVGTD